MDHVFGHTSQIATHDGDQQYPGSARRRRRVIGGGRKDGAIRAADEDHRHRPGRRHRCRLGSAGLLAKVQLAGDRVGIDGLAAVRMDLEVEVIHPGVAGHSDKSDHGPSRHRNPDGDAFGEARHVSVEEVGPVGQRQADGVAASPSGVIEVLTRNRSVGDGVDRHTGVSADVEALVDPATGAGIMPGIGEPTLALDGDVKRLK